MSFLRRTAVLVAIGLVTACTSAPKPDVASPASSTVSPASSTTTTPGSKAVTPQGFLPKKAGEQSGEDCPSGADSCATLFTVERIEVNPQCGANAVKPEAGHKTIVLHAVMTTRALDEAKTIRAQKIFAVPSLKGLGPDGTVYDSKPAQCGGFDGWFPTTIVPNSRFVGRVELDVPETSAFIASVTELAADGTRGWAWPIG